LTHQPERAGDPTRGRTPEGRSSDPPSGPSPCRGSNHHPFTGSTRKRPLTNAMRPSTATSIVSVY